MPSLRPRSVKSKPEALNLDSPFDRLTAVASAMFDMPFAMVSVVDGDQTLFRVNVGEKDMRLPRQQTITDLLIGMGPEGVFVVEDGLTDERVKDHPMVTGEPFLRAYMGVTIVNAAGKPVGAIGVMDAKPRPAPRATQIANLRLLAGLAGHEIDTACLLRKAAEHTAMLEMSEALAGLGHWRYDLLDKSLSWSDQVYRIHGTEPGVFTPSLAAMGPLYHPADLDEGRRMIERAVTTGEGYDTRLRLVLDGDERVNRSRARVEHDDQGRIQVWMTPSASIIRMIARQCRTSARGPLRPANWASSACG